ESVAADRTPMPITGSELPANTATITALYFCQNCKALYQIVKVEAGPQTADREVTCRDCGAPFPVREGKFALKYLMLRRATRVRRWKRQRRTKAGSESGTA